jgi:hypothetical protein
MTFHDGTRECPLCGLCRSPAGARRSVTRHTAASRPEPERVAVRVAPPGPPGKCGVRSPLGKGSPPLRAAARRARPRAGQAARRAPSPGGARRARAGATASLEKDAPYRRAASPSPLPSVWSCAMYCSASAIDCFARRPALAGERLDRLLCASKPRRRARPARRIFTWQIDRRHRGPISVISFGRAVPVFKASRAAAPYRVNPTILRASVVSGRMLTASDATSQGRAPLHPLRRSRTRSRGALQ